MRDYAKVSPQFWIGKTGRQIKQLGIEPQHIALYLVTCPHASMIGVYYLPVSLIAHETGISLEGACKGLKRLCELGFCSYDFDMEYIWVHEMARFQIGEKLKQQDNRIKSVQNAFLSMPNLQFLQAFYEKYRTAFWLPESAYVTSPLKGAAKGLQSQEQEQEQEQENKKSLSDKSDPHFPENNFCNDKKNISVVQPKATQATLKAQAIEVLNFLNQKTGRAYRPVDANLKLIMARLKNNASIMQCRQVIAKKTREWLNEPKMTEYLRPATLFNATKFEQYVGELVLSKTSEENHENN